MIWQVQTAKNKFTELINKARTSGAQTVSRRGEPVAIVISYEDYLRLTRPKSRKRLSQFFKSMEMFDIAETIVREPARDRDVSL